MISASTSWLSGSFFQSASRKRSQLTGSEALMLKSRFAALSVKSRGVGEITASGWPLTSADKFTMAFRQTNKSDGPGPVPSSQHGGRISADRHESERTA